MLGADSSGRVQSERAGGEMTQIRQEAEIDALVETIFAPIVHLRACGRWLAKSDVFEGTTDISSDPIAWTKLVRARPKTAPFPFGVQKQTTGPDGPPSLEKIGGQRG